MRYYSSTFAKTTLVGDITASVTSLSLASTTGLPASFPFTLIISPDGVDEEVVEATAVSGNVVTVTRGVDGTSAQTHTAGTSVAHGVSARDFAEPQAHMAASQAVHGLAAGSSVVGTADTQTLTNKTLTSPTLNAPTISSGTGTLSNVASTGGTFTSAIAKTFTAEANAAADVSAIIQAIAGQTGDVLQVKGTAGTPALKVRPDGTVGVGETTTGYARFTVVPISDSDLGQVIRQFSATQTGNLLDFRAANGTTVLASVAASGAIGAPSIRVGNSQTLNALRFNRGTVTSDANGLLSIAHNLGVVPVSIFVSPLTIDVILLPSSWDATNITFLVKRASDATTIANASIDFFWLALA